MPDVYEKDKEEQNSGNQYEADTEQQPNGSNDIEASEHKSRLRDRLRRSKDASSPEELDEKEKSGGKDAGGEAFNDESSGEGSFLDLAGGTERFFKDTDKPKRFRLNKLVRGDFRRN